MDKHIQFKSGRSVTLSCSDSFNPLVGDMVQIPSDVVDRVRSALSRKDKGEADQFEIHAGRLYKITERQWREVNGVLALVLLVE